MYWLINWLIFVLSLSVKEYVTFIAVVPMETRSKQQDRRGGATGGCKMPNMGIRNQIQVFWKSNKNS